MGDSVITSRPRRSCAAAQPVIVISDDDSDGTTNKNCDSSGSEYEEADDIDEEEYEIGEYCVVDELIGSEEGSDVSEDLDSEKDSDYYLPASKKRKIRSSLAKPKASRPARKSPRESKSRIVTSASAEHEADDETDDSIGDEADDETDDSIEDEADDEADYSIGDDDGNRPEHRRTGALKDTYTFRIGIAVDTPPIATIESMFEDMTEKARAKGFDKFLNHFDGRPLRVATMCSGTESPIFALDMISKHLEKKGLTLAIEHLFSAEIVPWKQSYILQNANPSILFRDITEFFELDPDDSESHTATTAYGAKATVPGGVDMLVAGTCCVDFSRLNRKRLDIEALGESGDTFFAMRRYAELFRPKIIILENVISAPWVSKGGKLGMDNYMAEIGYATAFVKLNTRLFHIPHTRERGYMICVDRQLFSPGSDKKVDILISDLTDLISNLKHEASVPVESLLLPADDPFLRSSSAQPSEQAPRKKVAGWDRCHIGHQEYRAQLNLGTKRPISDWKPDGSTRNPDFYIPLIRQVERISDTIDIAHLRNLLRGMDDRYINRHLDMSQNVYRYLDNAAMGIVPCLTPSGLPFSTLRGGRITGYESMKLQGLPVDEMDLSQLSQANLQDLAGNAMTSTVVGATMLAALTIFYKYLQPDGRVQIVKKQLEPSLTGEDTLVRKEADAASYTQISVQEVKNLASETARLCYCEGRHDRFATAFVRCKFCKHTACTNCARNPKHHYEPVDQLVIESRKDPAEFEDRMKRAVPMKMCLMVNQEDVNRCISQFHHHSDLSLEDKDTTAGFIIAALNSEVSFRGMRRRELWEILFESAHAKLVLTISHDILWLLYAKVPSKLSSNDPVRRFLEQYPIARMTPLAENVLQGSWQFFVPDTRGFEATITSGGKLLDSFEADRGLVQYLGTSVHEQCDIKIQQYESKYFDNCEIGGQYSLSQECGQAFNSLHVNTATHGASPLFFYFDHQLQATDPEDHYFVFTKDHRRLDYGEHRPVVARLDKEWRQPRVKDDSSMPKTISTTIYSDGYWSDFGTTSIDLAGAERIIFNHITNHVDQLEKGSCDNIHAALVCQLQTDHSGSSFSKDMWISLQRSNETAFFSDFSWIFPRGSVLAGHLSQHLFNVDHWHGISIDHCPEECLVCAPTFPKTLWAFEKTSKRMKVPKPVPFEDPEEASNFEKALKQRPQPISAMFRLDGQNLFTFKMGINPATLTHRARALLVGSNKSPTTKTSWFLATDVMNFSRPRLLQFELISTKDEKDAPQPPELMDNRRLRSEQLKKVAWMINQEEKGVSFVEREFVEARVDKLGYLLMGQASREKVVRGGILADEVGFGKTIVILALVASRLGATHQFASSPIRGAIPLKATLIFVPKHLPKQWVEEARNFFGCFTAENVLEINNMKQLQTHTIRDFMNAEIIVVNWEFLLDEAYLSALAQISGMVELAQKPTSRARSLWHKTAREKLKESVDELQSSPSSFRAHLKSKLSESREEARSLQLPVASKRVTGAAYQARGAKRKLGDNGPVHAEYDALKAPVDYFDLKCLGKEGWESLKCPVLEMFHFARIVVDEYSFINARHHCSMMSLEAEYRWALSGTAQFSTFHEVKRIARFLNINLGVDDYSSMKPDVYKKETEDMTSSEKLLTFQGVPSAPWLELRHAHAGVFLHKFVRKDLAVIAPIRRSEHICLIRQPASQLVAYLELQQRLAATDFVPVPSRFSKGNFEKQISEVLGKGKGSGREALLLRAAHYTIQHDDLNAKNQPQNAREACEFIFKIRAREYEELEKKFLVVMDRAVWLRNEPESRGCSRLDNWVIRLQENLLDDRESSEALFKLINDHAIPDYRLGNWEFFYRTANDVDPKRSILEVLPKGMVDGVSSKAQALRKCIRDLNNIAHEYVSRKRAARFLDVVCRLQSFSGGSSLQCDGCGCTDMPVHNFFVLCNCGHLVCRPCSDIIEGICPSEGCEGGYERYQKIPASKFTEQQGSDGYYQDGKKLQEIVDLINNIPEDDQVLLFIQSVKFLHKVATALERADISFASFKSQNAASKLSKFQKTKDTKVLILNIGDCSASGSNLTMANHIIFLSPYLSSGSNARQDWDAAVTQAIGRAYRYGQWKHLHIYHFLASETIDVDIFEGRHGGYLRTSSDIPEITLPHEGFLDSGIECVRAQPGDMTEFGSSVAYRLNSDAV